MNKFWLLPLSFALLAAGSLQAATKHSVNEIIDRGRATVGLEEKLDGLVTLKIVGRLEPVDPNVPEATLLIIARKPHSQRLEIRVDDMVETTILNGRKGCLVRSKLDSEASQMRALTDQERKRILYTTRQFFSFYRPDYKHGEKVTHEGTIEHRNILSHKLRYVYPDGTETTRFFSAEQDFLVSVVSDNGVESVNIGAQIVGGIEYPERIDYYENGQKLHSVVLAEIEVNQPLAPGIFRVPHAKREEGTADE